MYLCRSNNQLIIYMKTLKFVVLMTISSVSLNASAQTAPQLRSDNIDEVMAAMTLEEKAQILVGGANNFFSDGAVVGAAAETVPGAAGTTAAIPRLGIPETILTDGPAGVRINPTRKGDTKTYYATAFPIGSALASTWNTELVEEVGKAIGNETKEYRCDVILGPGMNLHRNPLCGRNFEYYSEDPVVTGKIAAAYVKGVQSEGAGTSIKHFAVNSQETERTSVDERVSQRALRELYLRGFEIAVREGKPWTVMASYNRVNGPLTQESHDLLTDVLRTDWGYQGMVMTDWIGQRNTGAQVHAGNDLMEPGQPQQCQEIVTKVKNGQLDIKDVDTSVRRLLEYIVKTPSFKHYAATNAPDLKAHAAITRRAANEGIVLLENNGVLPLDKKIQTVALYGVCSYEFLSGGVGSGCVHPPYVVDMVTGLGNAGIKTTESLTEIYQKYVDFAKLKFETDRNPAKWFQSPEMGQQKYPEIDFSEYSFMKEVPNADAAIITLGRQAGEGIDREIEGEFNLTEQERQMVKQVSNAFHQAGKPVIVIINSGSVIETASWKNYADAVLVAWQPGMEGGNSVADILTGKANPSGKLTMTWPLDVTDHPSTKNFPNASVDIYTYTTAAGNGRMPGYHYTNHEEDIYVGYRYFDTSQKNVSYPFGYGLSYTTFAYSKPSVKKSGEQIEVSITVKNTGKVAGKEAVQVYVAAPKGNLEKPAKELKAFSKTRELQPGESQTLRMTLLRRDLASFDEEQSAWIVDAGTYQFLIAASATDIRATASLKVDALKEPTTNALKPQVKLNRLSVRK